MCEEGQQQEATHSCRDCQQCMCRSCRHLHDRVTGTRDHRVEPITTQPPSKPEVCAVGNKLCQFHPGQALCFHCCKCDISICLHCKLTSHEGHETEDMATAALRAKEELAAVIAKARNQVRKACSTKARNQVSKTCSTKARNQVRKTCSSKARNQVRKTCSSKARSQVRKTSSSKARNQVRKHLHPRPEIR